MPRRCMLPLLFAAVCLAAGCQVQKPRVALADVLLHHADFQKMDLSFHLEVYNPNNFDIVMEAMDYRITAEGRELHAGSFTDVPLMLPSTQSRTIDIKFSFIYAKGLEILENVRAGQIVPYQLAGTGKFNVMNVVNNVEFKHDGQIAFLKLPEWKFKKVSLARDHKAIELYFDVSNPNALPIPLLSVSGGVFIGPDELVSINEKVAQILQPNQTGELKFEVKVHPSVIPRVLKELVKEGKAPNFKGELNLTPPGSLRELLLGRIQMK